jgi:hypothetical protein
VPLTRNIHHLKSKRPAVSQPAQVSTLFPVRLPSLRPPCIRSPLRRVRLPATVRQVTLIYYQEISKHSYHDTDISCPGIHKPSGTHKLILNIGTISRHGALHQDSSKPLAKYDTTTKQPRSIGSSNTKTLGVLFHTLVAT